MATLEAGDVGGDAQMGYELIVQQTKLPEGLVGVENVDAKVDALAVMIIEAGKLQPGQEVLVWFDKDVAVLAGRVAEMAGEVAGNVKF